MRLQLKRFVIVASTLFALIILLYIWTMSFGRDTHWANIKLKHSNHFKFQKIGALDNADQAMVNFQGEHDDAKRLPKISLNRSANSTIGGMYSVDDFGISSDLWIKESKINYNLNIWKSETVPLNRRVPDSRPEECASLRYPKDLPSASVVITMHNEWPSVVLRTVRSIINRTPTHLLKEIILVDDASNIDIIKTGLKKYIVSNFKPELVRLIRLQSRQGLIRSRLEGLNHVKAKVVVFLDSHMEVNQLWLQPLLKEIVSKRETLALAQLDYIDKDTFDYNFYPGYRTRYGFRWDMQFFETYFRPDQTSGKANTDPLPGVLFVGTGFAVDVSYFKHIGSYDPGMMIWGGENIELAWRVWMCGGQILHIPCSHIGHIERSQPYTFPEGRMKTEMYNYKRAVDIWVGDYKEYVYKQYPGMKAMDAGSLGGRDLLPQQLNCHNFTWYIDNIWPELLRYREDGDLWGMIKTSTGNLCLDNDDFVFQGPYELGIQPCIYDLQRQGFSLTKSGELKTTIHCVIAMPRDADLILFIENCFISPPQKWEFSKNQLIHKSSGMCLQAMGTNSGQRGIPVLQPCRELPAQKWIFESRGLL